MIKRRPSTKLIELKRLAKLKGWAQFMRKGDGEEADEQALLNGCWYSIQRAEYVCDWIESYCHLVEGPWRGRKFQLIDWQREVLSQLFGWVKWSPEWGRIVRRFRWAYLELPKKNGKSPLMAAVGCYLMFGDGATNPKNFSVATAKKQAALVHRAAVDMVQASPELSSVARIRTEDGYQLIEYPEAGGRWSITSSDSRTADGINGNCLADELHRWNDWEFWGTLRWMLAALPEGLFFAITTAGSGNETICKQQRDKTLAVNSGRQTDEQFFGRVWGIDAMDDPHEERSWLKANPSLGRDEAAPLKLSTFRADYHAATVDPTQWPDFLRLRLGVWQSAERAWVDSLGGIGRWDAGEAARGRARGRIDCWESFSLDDLAEAPCWFAIDGATHHDTTAAVFVWPGEADELRIMPFYWLPEAEAQRLGAKVPYRDWSDQGLITLTPGDACDYARVRDDLVALCKRLNVRGFAFDPLFQAEWLTQQIEDETGVPRTEFRQTIMSFSPAMKTLGRLITIKKARHNGHQILTWQLGHVACYSDANGNQRPVRQKLGDHRTIDGVVAAIMAVGLMTAGDDTPCYYDEDDHAVEFL
jgi:phage terminase large subunit-like protein